MAIIYSYPTVTPSLNDLVLGTDVDNTGKATRNFTVQSIIDLVTVTGNNLQDVLNNGNSAVGRDIILGTVQDPAQTIYANTFNTGVASIVGGVGQNFTDFTSTRITGTLQTNAQPNITSLGTLTSLKVGSATPAITSIVTSLTAPGDDIKLATTKAIVDYIATTPNPETLAQTLIAGQVTGGKDIIVSAGDDVTFTDTSKIILGTGSDATVEHDGTDLKILNTLGKTTISNSSGDIDISATAATKKLNLNGTAGVELQFGTGKRLETLLGGAKVSGTFEATGVGTLNGIVNTNSYTDSSGDTGTAGQILSSTGASGTNWITDPNPTPYSWLVEADSGSGSPYTVANGNQIHFKGDTNISTSWNNTNKEVLISLSGTSVTGTGAVNQVTYWDGAQTITGAAGFTFAGGATGKVAIGGELEVGGVLTDGTFTGSSGTYTGYASISSTVFVGPLQGNADTATALAAAGTVSMSGDTVAAGVTYTSGGNVPLVSTISDSVVYNKELSGFNATSGSVANGDSIIEALEKLQGQITNLPQGLVYQGVWSAAGTGGGTPDLTQASYKVNGHFYICDTAGTAAPNGTGNPPNDWDVRDWVIFADDGAGGGVDEWQKIDNSSLAGGTGTPNTMTKWLTNQTIGNSNITDNGSVVTIADTIDFTTQGNNTFGNTSADTTLMKGNTTLEQNLILAKGLSLGTDYGSAGQALISGGGVGVANSWTDLTVGTVTSVSATTAGDALDVAVTNPTTTPAIALTWAGGASGATKYVNGLGNLITFPTLDNYQYWTLSDGTNTTNITTTGTATFASGTGIINTEASGTITTAIDYVGNNNAIEAAADGTSITLAATDKLWVSDADDNTIKQINVSQVSGVLDQNLAEVLAVNNVTGGTDIAVSAADDITFTDTSKALFGTGNDLQIFHNGTGARIENATGASTILSDTLSINNAADSETMAQFIHNGAVDLYHNGLSRFKTTTTGVEVVNTDANVPPTILLNQDSKNFTITQAVSGAGQIINSFGSLSLRNDGSINLQNNAGTYTKASFDSSISFSPDNLAGTATVPGVTIYQSTDATADGTRTRVYGNLQVDGNIIHADAGNSGTYNFDDTVNASSNEDIFSITGGDGACAFTVYFTCNTASYSVAKVYTVVHSYGTTVVYNKLVDSGPYGGHDFTPTFTGATNVLTCNIANGSGSISANISTTVILGASPQNLTVAAL